MVDDEALAEPFGETSQSLSEDDVIPTSIAVDDGHFAALLVMKNRLEKAHDRGDAAASGQHYEVPLVQRPGLDGEVPRWTEHGERIARFDRVIEAVADSAVWHALHRDVHRHARETCARQRVGPPECLSIDRDVDAQELPRLELDRGPVLFGEVDRHRVGGFAHHVDDLDGAGHVGRFAGKRNHGPGGALRSFDEGRRRFPKDQTTAEHGDVTVHGPHPVGESSREQDEWVDFV